jgi:predicted DCC family thiol-disulfide oxidoreductase YuxK
MTELRERHSPVSTVMERQSRIVVFDGLCNLCSGGARWLEQHQSERPFRLVPMQSDLGRALLVEHGCDPDDPLTFLVLDDGRCLTQSDAWMHLMASVAARLATCSGGASNAADVARLSV